MPAQLRMTIVSVYYSAHLRCDTLKSKLRTRAFARTYLWNPVHGTSTSLLTKMMATCSQSSKSSNRRFSLQQKLKNAGGTRSCSAAAACLEDCLLLLTASAVTMAGVSPCGSAKRATLLAMLPFTSRLYPGRWQECVAPRARAALLPHKTLRGRQEHGRVGLLVYRCQQRDLHAHRNSERGPPHMAVTCHMIRCRIRTVYSCSACSSA